MNRPAQDSHLISYQYLLSWSMSALVSTKMGCKMYVMMMTVTMMMMMMPTHGWRPPRGGGQAQRATALKLIASHFAKIQNWASC